MAPKYETAPVQDMIELKQMIKVFQAEGVKSYLEIGSKHGGSLWHVATSLPARSKIVSVDLPHGDSSFKESEPHLRACIKRLGELGFDAHLIIGDSTNPAVVAQVKELAPFDAVFIDADHTEPYVRQDWANYGSLGKIVAFHDIGWTGQRPSKKRPIEVPKVWAELKQKYPKHREFRVSPIELGIGVLWRE